jgi:hypothetical protein
MIDRNERVLIMHEWRSRTECGGRRDASVDPQCESPAWYHEVDFLVHQTRWDVFEVDDFECDVGDNRYQPLVEVNHYLTAEDGTLPPAAWTLPKLSAASAFRIWPAESSVAGQP